MSDAFTFKIVRRLAVLKEASEDGYSLELNLVSFCNKAPKLDCRSWDSSHSRMSRGMQFDDDTAERLAQAIAEYLSESRA